MPDLGPMDIANYLFWRRNDLLTVAEREARDMVVLREKIEGTSSPGIKKWLESRYPKDRPEAEALLADGPERFRERVVARVLAEHGMACLNLCPKCGALCRTRRARQCPRCFFHWHESKPVT
jgi:hypothetical protein